MMFFLLVLILYLCLYDCAMPLTQILVERLMKMPSLIFVVSLLPVLFMVETYVAYSVMLNYFEDFYLFNAYTVSVIAVITRVTD